MNTIIQVSILGIITSLSCVLLRKHAEEASVLLSLSGVVLILLLAVRFLSPLFDVFSRLKTMAGLMDEVTTPMLKVAGISLLTQITGAVCDEAGAGTLSKAVAISGMVLAMYAGIPLLLAVISLLEDTLL